MPTASNTDVKPLTVNDFTNMYNKWLKELIDVEDNLIKKAVDTQSLQYCLNEDSEILKGVNKNILSLEIELNYLEDHLQSFMKEQEELEREIVKLDEVEKLFSDDGAGDDEDYPAIFESIDSELTDLKSRIKEMVDKINAKLNNYEKHNNPFVIYRTIMDRYTDALQTLETSTREIHSKLEKLAICD